MPELQQHPSSKGGSCDSQGPTRRRESEHRRRHRRFFAMGRKKAEEAGPASKAKKEKFSVSAMLASMDEKPDKPKKVSSSSSKPKAKSAPKVSSYTDGIDLPPSDDEDEDVMEEEQEQNSVPKRSTQHQRPDLKPLDVPISDKELKKREKKDLLAAHAAELAKQEALKDDRDAFTVVIGSRTSVLEGENDADANVKDVTIENFSVSARGKELLKNASVKISHGKRYGLVGPNGKGKSTLLKLLAWRKIPVPKNIDVLLVEQEVVGDDKTALEAVVSANEELIKTRQEVALLQNASAVEESADKDGSYEDDAGEKLAELYDKLQLMGSDAAEAQASKILAGLGFTKDMQGRATKSFSGGWRMRISLARALFVQPTLLLLDEPTNHLDLRAVLWLEEYLCRWKKTLVVVSHDRDFLNTVCNEIIHLHDLKLHIYRGNFADFESGYEQRRKEMNKKFEIYDKQLKAAKRSGNRVQQERVKDRAKFAASKEAAKSKGKGKVDEDEAPAEVPQKWRDYSVEFHFPEPTELTPPLLQLSEVSFSCPNRLDFRLSNVDVGIDKGTRVAIVGPNGAGKSTLLNLLAGDLSPTEGEVRRSQKLRIGRYSQHFVDPLTMDETPVEYLLRLHPDQEGLSKQEAVRAKLGCERLETLPQEIWKLQNLEVFDLSGTQIAHLPEFLNLPKLRSLLLRNNLNLMKIPSSFFDHMPLLSILDLSRTSIHELPSSIFNLLELREFYLKDCELFVELPPEINRLTNLKTLDLDGTLITHLPKEIRELSNLESLSLSLYNDSNFAMIPLGVLSQLTYLKVLRIGVNSDNEWWFKNVEHILAEINGLKMLQALDMYIPKVNFLNLKAMHLSDFRFIIGYHKPRMISRVPPAIEVMFKENGRSLKFVNGKDFPDEVETILSEARAFFLDRHMTINNLAQFGLKNLKQLKLCILAECNEMQSIVVDMDEYGADSGLNESFCMQFLTIFYMKNLRSIINKPILGNSIFYELKLLALHSCPELTTIFTMHSLHNLVNLEELIVEDCPKVSSIVSCPSSERTTDFFIPRLRKLSLLFVPELASISNGVRIGRNLKQMGLYYCPKLQSLSTAELSSEKLKVIRGETEWWKALKWSEAEWGQEDPPHKFNKIFSPIDEDLDIFTQLTTYKLASFNNENDSGEVKLFKEDDSGGIEGEPPQSSSGKVSKDMRPMTVGEIVVEPLEPSRSKVSRLQAGERGRDTEESKEDGQKQRR